MADSDTAEILIDLVNLHDLAVETIAFLSSLTSADGIEDKDANAVRFDEWKKLEQQFLRSFVAKWSQQAEMGAQELKCDKGVDWYSTHGQELLFEEGAFCSELVDNLIEGLLKPATVEMLYAKMHYFYPWYPRQLKRSDEAFTLDLQVRDVPLPPRIEGLDKLPVRKPERLRWPIMNPIDRIKTGYNISRAEVGRRVGINSSRLRRLAEGQAKQMSRHEATLLSNKFDVEVDELLFEYLASRNALAIRFDPPGSIFCDVPEEWLKDTFYGHKGVSDLCWKIYLAATRLLQEGTRMGRCKVCGSVFRFAPRAPVQYFCPIKTKSCRDRFHYFSTYPNRTYKLGEKRERREKLLRASLEM